MPELVRKVLYPTFSVNGIAIPPDAWVINYQQMVDIMGWEDEPTYRERMAKANPKRKPEEFGFGDRYLLKDEYGNKVMCWNNNHNRPFEEQHARRFSQEVLNRRWAGAITFPGETINGETMVVGRTGEVESGQHRGAGYLLAVQIYRKNPAAWKHLWPEEPVFESLVVFGASEHPKIVQTFDNVKPRQLSDVFYTSEVFAGLSNTDRREHSRMLDAAVDLLWKRTGAGLSHDVGFDKRYQTHSTSRDFLDRHAKLLECVKEIFACNKTRQISLLKLSPGQCAACLYLMASGTSDRQTYTDGEPSSEEVLKWDRWAKAVEFFQLLSDRAEAKLGPVREALGAIVDEEGGRQVEKQACIAKAWSYFLEGRRLDKKLLKLARRTDANGVSHLDEWPGFGGIDLGPKKRLADEDPQMSEEELAQRIKDADAAKRARTEDLLRTAEVVKFDEQGKPPAPKLLDTPRGKATPKAKPKDSAQPKAKATTKPRPKAKAK